MVRRVGLRIARWPSWLPARHVALVGWVAAATLTAVLLDMPLHPGPARGPTPASTPGEEARPRVPERPPPPKAKEKIIEIAPWEQVPA